MRFEVGAVGHPAFPPEPLVGRHMTKAAARKTKSTGRASSPMSPNATGRRENHAGDGQPEHAPSRGALRSLPAGAGQGAMGSALSVVSVSMSKSSSLATESAADGSMDESMAGNRAR